MQKNNDKSEVALIAILIKFLNSEGFKVRLEVPNMGQSIDITATKNRWITAIEAKLHDWKRGMNQCRAHELVADYICLAVAIKNVSPNLINEALKKGYGIIQVDLDNSDIKWVQKPKRNKRIWLAQRKILSKHMREIEYAE